MTDEPRILTDQETATRRAEAASSAANQPILMCTTPGCPRAARYGPWCDQHRQAAGPRQVIADNLTDWEIDEIRAEVDAKAAPLFLIAMDWILRGQLATMGVELAAPVTVTRDDR